MVSGYCARYVKARLKLLVSTELKNFPLFCPKCKQEFLINVKDNKVTIIKEPDVLDTEPIFLTKNGEGDLVVMN